MLFNEQKLFDCLKRKNSSTMKAQKFMLRSELKNSALIRILRKMWNAQMVASMVEREKK